MALDAHGHDFNDSSLLKHAHMILIVPGEINSAGGTDANKSHDRHGVRSRRGAV
jgi:hypothetical protein